MTRHELERRVGLYSDRMDARQRQLAWMGVPLFISALIGLFLPRDAGLLVLQVCVGGAVCMALYIVLSSRYYFASVEIRCQNCGRSVAGVYGTALEGVEYGEPLPPTLSCPRCGREFASLAT